MTYRLEYLESVVREPLRYSFKGARRLRVGDWRVVYTIEPPSTVLIVKIGHRSEVYEP